MKGEPKINYIFFIQSNHSHQTRFEKTEQKRNKLIKFQELSY